MSFTVALAPPPPNKTAVFGWWENKFVAMLLMALLQPLQIPVPGKWAQIPLRMYLRMAEFVRMLTVIVKSVLFLQR
jgi:hypothetical protein